MSFKEMLFEVLTRVSPYMAQEDKLVLLQNDRGTGFYVRNPTGRAIWAHLLDHYEEFQGNACFGNIPYLKSLLGSSFIRSDKSQIHAEYGLAQDKQTQVLQRLEMVGPRFKATYQCMDPVLHQSIVNAIKPIGNLTFSAEVALDDEIRDQFKESYRIMSQYDRPDLLRLELESGTLSMILGQRTDKTTLVLKTQVEGTDFSQTYAVKDLEAILAIPGDQPRLWLSDKALKLGFKTELVDYTFIAGRKTEEPKRL